MNSMQTELFAKSSFEIEAKHTTHSGGKGEYLHDWYSYLEGFSSSFVYEILKNIFKREDYTCIKYLLNIVCSCKELQLICEDNELWKFGLIRMFKCNYNIRNNSVHINPKVPANCGFQIWINEKWRTINFPENRGFKAELEEKTSKYYLQNYHY